MIRFSVLLFLTSLLSCASPSEDGADPVAVAPKAKGPEYIRVQHILIGFKDAVGFKGEPPAGAVERTEDQAHELASELFERVRAGADFDALVEEYTDDQAPGIYGMSNFGAAAKEEFYPREKMVQAFGDVGFALEVGEIGMTNYDPATSKYGWHIIKRVE